MHLVSRLNPRTKKSSSVEQVEHASFKSQGDSEDLELLRPEVRQYAERRLVRKLDCRVLPTIILIFILNYIDVCLDSCEFFEIIDEVSSVTRCLLLVSKA